MKLFNPILFILLLTLILLITLNISSDEDVVEEYQIEFIIFQREDVASNEKFSSLLPIPGNEFLTFQDPGLQINITALNNSIYPNESEFKDIFQNIKAAEDDSNDKEHSSPHSNPKKWFRKNNNLEILKKLNLKLDRSNKYNVIDSYSWIQNIKPESDSAYLHFRNNLYGIYLKLYRERFLHINLKAYLGNLEDGYVDLTSEYINDHELILKKENLKMNIDIPINLKLNKKNDYLEIQPLEENIELKAITDKKINIYIDESKRLFNGEVHYFDHPAFGIIISINKI